MDLQSGLFRGFDCAYPYALAFWFLGGGTYGGNGTIVDIGPITVDSEKTALWYAEDNRNWDKWIFTNAAVGDNGYQESDGTTSEGKHKLSGLGGDCTYDDTYGYAYVGGAWNAVSPIINPQTGKWFDKFNFILHPSLDQTNHPMSLVVRAGNNANGYTKGQALSTAHCPNNDNLYNAASGPFPPSSNAAYDFTRSKQVDLSAIPLGTLIYLDASGYNDAGEGFGYQSRLGGVWLSFADSSWDGETPSPTSVLALFPPPSAPLAPAFPRHEQVSGW